MKGYRRSNVVAVFGASILMVGLFTACGGSTTAHLPVVGDVPGVDGMVIKARATMDVQVGEPVATFSFFPMAYAATSGSKAVSVVMAPSTSMVMNAAAFLNPAVTNA